MGSSTSTSNHDNNSQNDSANNNFERGYFTSPPEKIREALEKYIPIIDKRDNITRSHLCWIYNAINKPGAFGKPQYPRYCGDSILDFMKETNNMMPSFDLENQINLKKITSPRYDDIKIIEIISAQPDYKIIELAFHRFDLRELHCWNNQITSLDHLPPESQMSSYIDNQNPQSESCACQNSCCSVSMNSNSSQKPCVCYYQFIWYKYFTSQCNIFDIDSMSIPDDLIKNILRFM